MKKLFNNVFVPTYFIFLSIINTWPLIKYITTSVIGGPGDNYYYVWLIGWFQKALFGLHVNPFIVPFHQYPIGWHLAYTETTLSNVFFALPFSLLINPIFGYNITLLLSFVLSGWFMYFWVYTETNNKLASLLSGTIFAFAPYRLAHSYGHLPLMGTQWLVITFFGLYKIIKDSENKILYSFIGGVGLGLASLSSMYYFYMSLIIIVVFTIGFTIFVDFRVLLKKSTWMNLILFCLIALPFLLLAIFPYYQLSNLGEENNRPMSQVDLWSASPTDYLYPSPAHFLWGKYMPQRSNWIEQYVYIGIIPLLLIIYGIYLFFISGGWKTNKQTIWLLFMIIVCIILSMGTSLHWNNQQVKLTNVPDYIERIGLIYKNKILLPNYLLFKYLPFYDNMRAWLRYGIYATLFLSFYSGIVFSRITKGLRKKDIIIFVFTVFLVLIDYAVMLDIKPVEFRPVDYWLSNQPGKGSVVEFPIGKSNGVEYIYGSLLHEKPLMGMFYGAYLPRKYKKNIPALKNFPDEASISILLEHNVEYIVVNMRNYDENINQEVEKYGLEQLASFGEMVVYGY
jgi:hypothetical protein